MDLLDALSGQDTAARRQVQSGSSVRPGSTARTWTSRSARPRSPPRPRSWRQACQPAGRPAGGAVAQEITGHDYDVTALVIPGSDPELAGAALAALLIAAGPPTPAPGRRTTDLLASVFYSDQHRHDQELPLEPDGLGYGPPLLMKTASGRHPRVRRGPIQITQRKPEHAPTGR
jgi:hypothetical protein